MKLKFKIGVLFAICCSFIVISACVGGKKEEPLDCADPANKEKTECVCKDSANKDKPECQPKVLSTNPNNNTHGGDNGPNHNNGTP